MKLSRIALILLTTLFTSGCATMQMINTSNSREYKGKWLEVDMAKTNFPSGAHLLGVMSAGCPPISSVVNEQGTPDYIGLSNDDATPGHIRLMTTDQTNQRWWCRLLWAKKDLFVNVDYLHNQLFESPLQNVSADDLPQQIVSQRNEAKRQEKQIEDANRKAMEEEARKEEEAKEAAAKSSFDNELGKVREQIKNVPEIIAKSKEMASDTLVFKGFYIGMPVTDACALLNHYWLKNESNSYFEVHDGMIRNICYLRGCYFYTDGGNKFSPSSIQMGESWFGQSTDGKLSDLRLTDAFTDGTTCNAFNKHRPLINAVFNVDGMTGEDLANQMSRSYKTGLPDLSFTGRITRWRMSDNKTYNLDVYESRSNGTWIEFSAPKGSFK